MLLSIVTKSTLFLVLILVMDAAFGVSDASFIAKFGLVDFSRFNDVNLQTLLLGRIGMVFITSLVPQMFMSLIVYLLHDPLMSTIFSLYQLYVSITMETYIQISTLYLIS